ncbi:hypothetical protein RvY_00390 [Ramazzottius varieornatus]|uniref:Uncharacterized protein n=1 Tax=Ramazzottius varieornatus TaxID=947166 RepID=A0A1D1UG94_RAMVA|nr:hypothetical protein RvY_00390 [Ramazzottius varieornatus]
MKSDSSGHHQTNHYTGELSAEAAQFTVTLLCGCNFIARFPQASKLQRGRGVPGSHAVGAFLYVERLQVKGGLRIVVSCQSEIWLMPDGLKSLSETPGISHGSIPCILASQGTLLVISYIGPLDHYSILQF